MLDFFFFFENGICQFSPKIYHRDKLCIVIDSFIFITKMWRLFKCIDLVGDDDDISSQQDQAQCGSFEWWHGSSIKAWEILLNHILSNGKTTKLCQFIGNIFNSTYHYRDLRIQSLSSQDSLQNRRRHCNSNLEPNLQWQSNPLP